MSTASYLIVAVEESIWAEPSRGARVHDSLCLELQEHSDGDGNLDASDYCLRRRTRHQFDCGYPGRLVLVQRENPSAESTFAI